MMMPRSKYSAWVRGLLTLLLLGVVIAGCGSAPRPGSRPPDQPRLTPTLLASGSAAHGANGILFDASDQLHVACVLGDEILVIDPETGSLLSTIGANQKVQGPDDIAFGPDGSLYWTAFSSGEVVRLMPDGTRTAQDVARGANAITFSHDGRRLFVALDFMGDALYELDPALVDPPRLIAENLGFLNAMDWGPDGFLYGPILRTGEIVRINVDTGETATVGDGFTAPVAVKSDAKGRLYVADHATGKVSWIDLRTGYKAEIAQLEPGLDNLALDSRGRLFVSSASDGSIHEVLSDGTVRTVSPGGMIAPGGVAVIPHRDGETVFVADVWSLREFDPSTGDERSVERHLLGVDGCITAPFTVSGDGNNLIVSSWFMDGTVQVFDPETGEVLEELDGFESPLNAIRFQGDIVVADLESRSVVRVDSDDPTRRRPIAQGLGVPVGLAATDNDLWVSDAATGMVLKIVADGQTLDRPVPVANGLTYPEGLAVDLDGSLLVVEGEAKRLTRIDPATGSKTTVAEGLDICLQGDHPIWVFNGVAVGPSGAIYVTCDVTNSLYVLEP
jgi:sugar lactone lactonase YvrE